MLFANAILTASPFLQIDHLNFRGANALRGELG
jgi:hypothetical protein